MMAKGFDTLRLGINADVAHSIVDTVHVWLPSLTRAAPEQ